MVVSSESVASGMIYLNGELVVVPSDLDPHVMELWLPVVLQEGESILMVSLASKPGSYIEVDFEPSE